MTFTEAKDSISSIDVNGAEILTGSVDGRVRNYDLRMGCMDQDVIGRKPHQLILKIEAANADARTDPVTSITTTKANDSYLVSTLDSTLRLMDKRDGKLLQAFTDPPGFKNDTYRIRSTLAAADSLVISGSEDGNVYVWDLLEGHVLHRLKHTQQALTDGKASASAAGAKRKEVVTAVAWNQLRREWASAGGDGSVVVWGMDR